MGPVPDQWENPENDLFGNRRSPKPERKMRAAVSGSDDHQEHVQRHEALAHPEPASVSYDEGGMYPRATLSTLTYLAAMLVEGQGGGGREDTLHGDLVRVSRARARCTS